LEEKKIPMGEEVVDEVIVNIETIDEKEREKNDGKAMNGGTETQSGEEKEKGVPLKNNFQRMDSLEKEASRVSGISAASKV
jgi:hypothetical protein